MQCLAYNYSFGICYKINFNLTNYNINHAIQLNYLTSASDYFFHFFAIKCLIQVSNNNLNYNPLGKVTKYSVSEIFKSETKSSTDNKVWSKYMILELILQTWNMKKMKAKVNFKNNTHAVNNEGESVGHIINW